MSERIFLTLIGNHPIHVRPLIRMTGHDTSREEIPVTLALSTPRSRPSRLGIDRVRTGVARRERRRLARQDRLSAKLAELHHIQKLMVEARSVISSGWVQHGWFTYRDEQDQQQTATTQDLPLVAGRPVTGACLVGAIVTAGGGESAAGSQPVQRALDLTWHTLYGGCRAVRWCPAPPVRTVHMCDLTQWNDHPDRTSDDVTALLHVVERAASVEIERIRAS
jgi:hypothetical protein